MQLNEEKASKIFDVKLNSNDELYSQTKLIELSNGCDGILTSITDKIDEETINKFATASHEYIESLKVKYPDVKKVMDSQDQFKADFADWREERGGIAPWPYEQFVKGKHKQ